MLHYLINSAAIWLLSLICFDALLRRSTFHSYNRFYLLGTLLAGIIIPLSSFQSYHNVYQPALQNNMMYASLNAKENLIQSAGAVQTNISTGFDWLMILKVIYLLGMLISFALLLRSIIKIFRLLRQGNKSVVHGLRIIETQQEHGPFSCFGFIFISSPDNYSAEQLSMILAHENRHNKYFHSLDLLLVELCKIILWFNPLLYVYKQRLLMVHEFQADKAVHQPISKYGAFLVEQSFVQNNSTFSHSFLHSPLKKRILMLTRKSPTWAKSKMLVVLPVMALALMCCSKKKAITDNTRVVSGNIVTYKGNRFEMYAPPADTVTMQNAETGKVDTVSFQALPSPVKMNGEQLLSDKADKRPALKEKESNTLHYGVFVKNKELLDKLDDGQYRISINNTVVGKNGEVLYFDWEGITNALWDNEQKGYAPVTPLNVKKEIDASIEQFIDKLEFNPAMKGGQPVVYMNGLLMPIRIEVKNHKASVIDDIAASTSSNIKSVQN
ncbi:MAG: M56 family metallopeptidase [Bacteroidota bacterium]